MTSNIFENFGIGIDIVEVEQFRGKKFSANKEFYKKIFSEHEIDYCLKFKDPYPHFAGKFAIKEAVIKSIQEKIAPIEIETSHSMSKPTIILKHNSYKFITSTSNEKNIAVGVVLSFKM